MYTIVSLQVLYITDVDLQGDCHWSTAKDKEVGSIFVHIPSLTYYIVRCLHPFNISENRFSLKIMPLSLSHMLLQRIK